MYKDREYYKILKQLQSKYIHEMDEAQKNNDMELCTKKYEAYKYVRDLISELYYSNPEVLHYSKELGNVSRETIS